MGMDGSGAATSAVVAATPGKLRNRSATERLSISATELLTPLDLYESRPNPNWLQLLALAREITMIAADSMQSWRRIWSE
jgi:hypothetical protein